MTARKTGSKQKRVTKGRSLHIGLNTVDPHHYAGWSGPLTACEFDANDMQALAEKQGFTATQLLTKAASRARVLAELKKASGSLRAGDTFLLTYSGHGGQVRDVSGEEPDQRDETWCLFDGQLIDDELYTALAGFAAGVRIAVLSDSCHSGTVVRAMPGELNARARLMPPDVAERTYQANKAFYDGLQTAASRSASRLRAVDPDAALARLEESPRIETVAKGFRAAAILISGCQDNQTSLDGDKNGAFTEQVLKVWRRGAFAGDHVRFHAEVKRRLPPSQTPNLFTLGNARAFLRARPFTLGRSAEVTATRARAYVKGLALPAAPPAARRRATRDAVTETAELVFDAGRSQAAVVGSSVISFVEGVTPQHREAIVNSSLLAQLRAKKVVPDPNQVEAWYAAYFDVLMQIGWVLQDSGFAEYKAKGSTFEVHKAILDVATAAFSGGATALSLVKTTLESLQKLDESTPWLTIFHREARATKIARFQIGLAQNDANGNFLVTLMAFHLKAKATLTQVLFFKFAKQKASLRHRSGSVTINTAVLDAISDDIKAKISAVAKDYVASLEI